MKSVDIDIKAKKKVSLLMFANFKVYVCLLMHDIIGGCFLAIDDSHILLKERAMQHHAVICIYVPIFNVGSLFSTEST